VFHFEEKEAENMHDVISLQTTLQTMKGDPQLYVIPKKKKQYASSTFSIFAEIKADFTEELVTLLCSVMDEKAFHLSLFLSSHPFLVFSPSSSSFFPTIFALSLSPSFRA
jgi:hypothetical protein